jgi:hypothetical protein
MQSIFDKLKLTSKSPLSLGQVPEDYNNLLNDWFVNLERQKVEYSRQVDQLFAFVHEPSDVIALSTNLKGKLQEDPILWIAYPKKSSKKNKGTLTRDLGWDSFAPLKLEPVSQLSLDDDYSILRFRRVDQIKKITRNPKMAISIETKKRTSYKK